MNSRDLEPDTESLIDIIFCISLKDDKDSVLRKDLTVLESGGKVAANLG
jgi:hypothetical protein